MQTAKSNQNPTLKAYEKRVKEDIRLIYDNLNDMLKLLRSDDEPGLSKLSQTDIDTNELHIRTSNSCWRCETTEASKKKMTNGFHSHISIDFYFVQKSLIDYSSFEWY
jgi:hypothetical protein